MEFVKKMLPKSYFQKISNCKDHTYEVVTTENGKQVQITTFSRMTKKQTAIWNYICFNCGRESDTEYYLIKKLRGGCRFCNGGNKNKPTKDRKEYYQDLLTKHNPFLELIEVIHKKGANQKSFSIFCNKHKKMFIRKSSSMFRMARGEGGLLCPDCIREKKIQNRKYSKIFIKTLLESLHYTWLNEDNYEQDASVVVYQCQKCGHIAKCHIIHIINGRRCKKCQGLTKKTPEEFRQEIYDLVGDEYSVLSDYINGKEYVLMRHNICGYEWNTLPTNFTTGDKRCPRCKRSKGEIAIEKCLQEMNIDAIPQYRFPDCKMIRCLPFDFYVPELNLCIEYQGQMHYFAIDFYGGEEAFKQRQEYDRVKKEYCIDHSINFLEIKYDQFENIKQILQDRISEIKRSLDEQGL